MSDPSRNNTIRFAAFELDPETGELRKHGLRIRLQDQPFKILIALLEKPGEVVSRDELRGRIWGNDTFVDFDHSLSAAVNRLRESLSDSADSPRYVETMARRGYRFIGRVEGTPEGTPVDTPEPAPQATTADQSYRKLVWLAACLLVFGGAGLLLLNNRTTLPAPHVVPLTTFSGNETLPAFSPDGKQVAFVWNGEKQDNVDIYVKVVGDTTALRLTNDLAVDSYPSWSPDGRRIAFVSNRGEGGVYVVSPIGGPEHKLADLKARGRPAWSPDGKSLLVSVFYPDGDRSPQAGALFSIAADGSRSPRHVLTPPVGTRYLDPALAPDGRSLAFLACNGIRPSSTCGLQVVQIGEEWRINGTPRQITAQIYMQGGFTWAADSTTLIFSGVGGDGNFSLHRISVRDGGKPERLELASAGAINPAIDSRNGRLAFGREMGQPDIWKLDLGQTPVPFLTSSQIDVTPQYSTDGRRIAFESGRSGVDVDIWVAGSDGTGLRQVTRMANHHSGSPRWSPDGRRIVFDSRGEGGDWDVWLIDEDGANLRQLTKGPAEDSMPSWSGDGNFIYFHSTRSGRSEIWRVPAQGGNSGQVTRNGGYTALESTDGKTLYYTLSSAGTEGVYAKVLPDGEEKQVMNEQVIVRGFAIFTDGVYYLHWVGGRKVEIRFHEFATRRSHKVGEIDGLLRGGFTVSADRKTFLFSNFVNFGMDLMLVENFK